MDLAGIAAGFLIGRVHVRLARRRRVLHRLRDNLAGLLRRFRDLRLERIEAARNALARVGDFAGLLVDKSARRPAPHGLDRPRAAACSRWMAGNSRDAWPSLSVTSSIFVGATTAAGARDIRGNPSAPAAQAQRRVRPHFPLSRFLVRHRLADDGVDRRVDRRGDVFQAAQRHLAGAFERASRLDVAIAFAEQVGRLLDQAFIGRWNRRDRFDGRAQQTFAAARCGAIMRRQRARDFRLRRVVGKVVLDAVELDRLRHCAGPRLPSGLRTHCTTLPPALSLAAGAALSAPRSLCPKNALVSGSSISSNLSPGSPDAATNCRRRPDNCPTISLRTAEIAPANCAAASAHD